MECENFFILYLKGKCTGIEYLRLLYIQTGGHLSRDYYFCDYLKVVLMLSLLLSVLKKCIVLDSLSVDVLLYNVLGNYTKT